MDKSDKFRVVLWAMLGAAFICVLVVSSVYYSAKNQRAVEMIEKGVNPVAVPCVFDNESGVNPTCIALATRRGRK